MNQVNVTCPHCGLRAHFDASLRGDQVSCGFCQQPFLIPGYRRLQCPKCLRNLRIRQALLGTSIACNHCNHAFLLRLREDGKSVLTGVDQSPGPPAEFGIFDPRTKSLEEEILRQNRCTAKLKVELEEVLRRGDEILRERDSLIVKQAELLDRLSEMERFTQGREAALSPTDSNLTFPMKFPPVGASDSAARTDAEMMAKASPDGPRLEEEGDSFSQATQTQQEMAQRLAELQDRLRVAANRFASPKS